MGIFSMTTETCRECGEAVVVDGGFQINHDCKSLPVDNSNKKANDAPQQEKEMRKLLNKCFK